jgi:hypothetical protein
VKEDKLRMLRGMVISPMVVRDEEPIGTSEV